MESKEKYLEVVYNTNDRPLTTYPDRLTSYLFEKMKMAAGMRILDVGCGRAEFLNGFVKKGLQGQGVDFTKEGNKYFPELDIKVADIEDQGLPFENLTFDVVFSKSVIEHFRAPEKLVSEIKRVLKPGGLVITMCPDWEINYRIYFEDFTHRTPFMVQSMRDIYQMHGFNDIHVEKFRQLPILWKYPFLVCFSELTRIFIPSFMKKHSKWIRFSKEVMLLGSAMKPGNN